MILCTLAQFASGSEANVSVFEVLPLQAAAAQKRMESHSTALTPTEGEAFAGSQSRCESGTSPFLIKALFKSAASGGYSAKMKGSTLEVIHTSRGEKGPESEAFLVACLAEMPAVIESVADWHN